MAKLPPIDLPAIWIRDALNRGDREKALRLLDEAIAAGRAGPSTLELAGYLRGAKRGRQPFGASYLWWDIGRDSDELAEQGMTRESRLEALGVRYMLAPRQVETALAKYNRAVELARQIDDEIEPR